MRERWDSMSNQERVLAAFIGLIVVGAFLENPAALLLVILLGWILYQSTPSETKPADSEAEWQEQRRSAQPADVNPVYRHALDASRAAGNDPNELLVLPVDIGVIAFEDSDPVQIHRSADVHADSSYIQPFVEIRVPQTAEGRIRFEIYDVSGELVFRHEDLYHLARGRTRIIPGARLPIHDAMDLRGQWELRVIADGLMLARHFFNWDEAADITDHLGEDGEINSELRAVLADIKLEPMSLDDLLSQDEAGEQRQRRS